MITLEFGENDLLTQATETFSYEEWQREQLMDSYSIEEVDYADNILSFNKEGN